MNLDELMDVQLIIIKDVKNHFLEIAKLSFNFNFECNLVGSWDSLILSSSSNPPTQPQVKVYWDYFTQHDLM